MLKAKAKAAATAAKAAKAKKAAEEAAKLRQQELEEAAAAGATTATATRPRTTISTRGRPAVTQLWVDAASSSVAPSGSDGILRISYDQQAFEEGVREVILEPRSREGWERHRRGEGEEEGAEESESKQQDEGKPQQQQKEVMPVNKDHLAFIANQVDAAPALIKAALRSHGGDVVKALLSLTVVEAEERRRAGEMSGREARRLVSV